MTKTEIINQVTSYILKKNKNDKAHTINKTN